MRSVVVVLPASICAAMPMFLILSSGTVLDIISSVTGRANPAPSVLLLLPPVVRESLVGFGHAMDVVSLLDCASAKIGSVVQFVRQLFRHAFFGTPPCVGDNPAHGQR